MDALPREKKKSKSKTGIVLNGVERSELFWPLQSTKYQLDKIYFNKMRVKFR